MATSNITATAEWTKIADATDDHLLVSTNASSAYEVATTAADAAPATSVLGHRMDAHDAVNRLLIGPGYVWARNIGSGDANLVVTK